MTPQAPGPAPARAPPPDGAGAPRPDGPAEPGPAQAPGPPPALFTPVFWGAVVFALVCIALGAATALWAPAVFPPSAR